MTFIGEVLGFLIVGEILLSVLLSEFNAPLIFIFKYISTFVIILRLKSLLFVLRVEINSNHTIIYWLMGLIMWTSLLANENAVSHLVHMLGCCIDNPHLPNIIEECACFPQDMQSRHRKSGRSCSIHGPNFLCLLKGSC